MEYYSGMFDAEGCLSIAASGSVQVRLNNTNEKIPNFFKDRFGGTIYKEPRKNCKTIWCWNAQVENLVPFCRAIVPYCLVKREQLELFLDYIDADRAERRATRPLFRSKISAAKKPVQVSRDFFCRPCSIPPDVHFFKWLAGFTEGDGSIRIYEQKQSPGVFSTCIAVGNVFATPIQHIYQRVNGSITLAQSRPHNMWRWTCSERNVKSLLINLMPHLKIMAEQAQLILDFLEIKASKRPYQPYTHDQVNLIRDIVDKVKTHNSI